MVNIDVDGFAEKVEEYHHEPDRPQEWFYLPGRLNLDDRSIESKLCSPFEVNIKLGGGSYPFIERTGISFDYTIKLVMLLLERAYRGLLDGSCISDYAKAVAEAMKNFAEPFPDEQSTRCYPHFLLHGIALPTMEEVICKIYSNSRIIHETLKTREGIKNKHGTQLLDGDLQLTMKDGLVDDYFGIAYLLAKRDAALLSSTWNYIAKTSFFVDKTKSEIYVMTIQGCKFCDISGEDEYQRIVDILEMGPRLFVLTKLKDFVEEQGFRKIKVIKPEEHPMFIEGHRGFFGNYEPLIRKAGITSGNGCYLESRL
ncbi:hypothetical protein KY366_02540 [Candidatus Woesearchaeota archaeon]|nr:hypothetical protein [Candidatus Woesearchaeota archaeon]